MRPGHPKTREKCPWAEKGQREDKRAGYMKPLRGVNLPSSLEIVINS